MMRFEYDPQFVEQATFLAARGHAERECLLHEYLDPLYRIGDAESRQRAFRERYGELFRLFGLDQIVPACAGEFALLGRRLGRCLIREAERSRAQAVDLYREKPQLQGSEGEQVLIMALCPECLLDQSKLRPWLYRQLQHVADMVDESFAYDRCVPGESVVQQNLVRDRYTVLWDTYVEGRLIRSHRIGSDAVEDLWRAFCRAFTRNGQSPGRVVFESLIHAGRLTHTQLIAWAAMPSRLLENGGGSNERNEEAGACAVA